MKRAYCDDYLVDGIPMLNPDVDVEVGCEDLVSGDSGLDETGVMHRIVVRHDIRTWGFSYAFLTAEEYSYLRSLFRGKTKISFAFPNESGEVETVTAYGVFGSAVYQSKRSGLYKNLKIEIFEC